MDSSISTTPRPERKKGLLDRGTCTNVPRQRAAGCPERKFYMGRQSPEVGINGRTSVARRSDRFLSGLADFKSVTFVSHVHPDPDSLGSMLGLAYLVEQCLGLPTRMTRDGEICRAENRVMVECLNLDLVPVSEIEWDPEDAVVMVDSQPRTGRHSFTRSEVPIYAVIDHHQTPGDLEGIAFLDIRRS